MKDRKTGGVTRSYYIWELIPFSLWSILAKELKCQAKERQMPIDFMATQSEFNVF